MTASTETSLAVSIAPSGRIFLDWTDEPLVRPMDGVYSTLLKDAFDDSVASGLSSLVSHSTVPSMEEAGIIVRVPNWWNASKPPRPNVLVRLGQEKVRNRSCRGPRFQCQHRLSRRATQQRVTESIDGRTGRHDAAERTMGPGRRATSKSSSCTMAIAQESTCLWIKINIDNPDGLHCRNSLSHSGTH